MPALTCAEKKAAYQHVMAEVFGLHPDSDVHKCLREHGFDNILDLTSISDNDIDLLSYMKTDDAGKPTGDYIPLVRGKKSLLKLFKIFHQRYH